MKLKLFSSDPSRTVKVQYDLQLPEQDRQMYDTKLYSCNLVNVAEESAILTIRLDIDLLQHQASPAFL